MTKKKKKKKKKRKTAIDNFKYIFNVLNCSLELLFILKDNTSQIKE